MSRPTRFAVPTIALAATVVASALTPACSSTPLGDAGLPMTGRRSYVVTSLLQHDGGFGSFPDSHKFTLVLDADQRTAIAGGAGQGVLASFEPTGAGALRFTTPLSFGAGDCGGATINYSELTIAIDASDRLTGTGRGQVTVFTGDTGSSPDATMSLTGERDAQPPALPTFVDVDPFTTFSVSASEPLPPSASAVLRAPDGETIALAPVGMAGIFITSFEKPPQILQYATQYQIVADGLTDFAGNAATGGTPLTTEPPPPFAAEDGFESVTGTTFGGVQVLSDAGEPTITGAKSLFIGPAEGSSQPTLSVRLAVAPGDTTVRFAYRTVNRGSSASQGSSNGVSWMLGSERGMIAVPALPANVGTGTDATIGGAAVTLGPIMTASVALPADATNEVVLQRTSSTSCGFPLPKDGIIIDDLRVE